MANLTPCDISGFEIRGECYSKPERDYFSMQVALFLDDSSCGRARVPQIKQGSGVEIMELS